MDLLFLWPAPVWGAGRKSYKMLKRDQPDWYVAWVVIKWWHSESIYFSAGLCDWVYTDLLFSTDNLSRYKWHMHDHQLTQERPCFSRWELRFGAASLSRALPLQLTARSRVDCAGQTRASTASQLRSTQVNLFSVKSDKFSPHPHFSTAEQMSLEDWLVQKWMRASVTLFPIAAYQLSGPSDGLQINQVSELEVCWTGLGAWPMVSWGNC